MLSVLESIQERSYLLPVTRPAAYVFICPAQRASSLLATLCFVAASAEQIFGEAPTKTPSARFGKVFWSWMIGPWSLPDTALRRQSQKNGNSIRSCEAKDRG